MPSSQLRLSNVSLSASGLKTVKTNVARRSDLNAGFDLTLGSGVTGFVGRNGSGKSTLLNFIAGRVGVPLVSGAVFCSGPVRLLEQSPDPDMRICELFGCADALQDLKRAEAGLPTKAAFEAVDWTLDTRLAGQLSRFGLSDIEPDRALGTLSGGQQLRAALAALFFDPPEILLLDEPTNALDLDARVALMAAMTEHKGLILVASHDRELLQQVDQIVALEPDGSISITGGGWAEFHAAREAERVRLAQGLEKANRDLHHHKDAAREAAARQERRARQGKALRDGSQSKMLLDKAKEGAEGAAGGRLRATARRDAVLRSDRDALLSRIERVTPVAMPFPTVVLASSKRVLEVEDACFPVGPREEGRVIGSFSLTLTGPERIWLKGPNGAGKSTLLRGIAGQYVPSCGKVLRHVDVALLDQTGLDYSGLSPEGTLVDLAQRDCPELSTEEIRAALARAGFRGEDAQKRIAALSGGERMRAAIAFLGAGDTPPPLLLLDEPTNHLDLDAIEALEMGLSKWAGAVIVVSHDPHFVQNLGQFREVSLSFA